MTILVTGGAGYIGSHTCVELLERGFNVIVADNLSNSQAEAVERAKRITNKEIPFYEVDIRNESDLDEIFSKNCIDSVIHFAGLKSVGESVAMPLAYYDNNLISTLTLCKVMERHNVKRIVFSSSATVYSSENTVPLTEDAATGCTNPYGWSKYMCEQILRDHANAHNGWSVLLLRYFNPIGAHSSGLIGENPKGIPNNLLPYISQAAIGIREKLFIYGDDYDTEDGTGVRDYIHVVDLAKGHVAAVEYAKGHVGAEAINLGTGKGTSVLKMIETFEKTNQVKIPYEITKRRPGDLAVCYANPSKAKKMLGWCAEKDLESMCADIWHWQTRNPSGYN